MVAGGGRRPRVLILTAGFGGGHNAVADELARRFVARDHDVRVIDLLEALPFRTGRIARRVYEAQIRRAPKMYEAFTRHRCFWAPTVLLGIFLSRRLIRRAIDESAPVVAVSTYPWASHVLGRQQTKGRLETVVAMHCDYAAHRSWIHPGVKLHLALHPGNAAAIRRLTDADVVVSGPVIDERFAGNHAAPAVLRRRLGLPETGRLALVTGGAWAVGDLDVAAEAVRHARGWTPVVLCGRDERLRDRLKAEGWIAIGWTDDMPSFVHACDALVETTSGVTGQEARAAGKPVIAFRPIAGHARMSAEALDDLGLNEVIDATEQLAAALERLADLPEPATPHTPDGWIDAADLILAAAASEPMARSGLAPARA
ncbi:MAG: processive 1,2-diacylglycerol beta-glucosyltransferase [Actinomycetota bacterium]|nr:processive 1,2-diacylglycerol beta-glucosyltransferase [Actinomycetota bacterium]